MSLKSALETAKEILEQASLEEGMHDKKKMKGDKDTEAPGMEDGAMSADGNTPEVPQPTDKKAKRPVMNKSAATGEAGAEEEDMHGGEEEDMHGGEEEDMHAMTPGEEEYEYEMEGDAEEEEMDIIAMGAKKAKEMTPGATMKMKEHLGKLFSGEELSEDFKEKASTVFEAAVTMRVDEIRTELDEEFDGKLEEAKAEMAEKLDQYLTYVVENWMKENQVAIEAGIKTDVTESFMSGLKELFETHYVTMPEESYDLIEGLNDKIDALEEKLNESTERNVELAQGLTKAQCEALYEAAAKDMTQSDESRFRGLVESLDFDGVEDFNEKLSTLKENFFDVEETAQTPLVEEMASSSEDALDESIELTPSMEAYAKALTRSASVHNATTLKD
tara:strand:- start:9 stop:1175 length:1167 start_codon:yes stop_codon:yes gene_type:complete